jgi:hypothetical protein
MIEGVAVVDAAPPVPQGHAETLAVLREWDAIARAEAPGAVPAFSEEAAVWSAVRLYHFGRFLACRDLSEAELDSVLGAPEPFARTPEAEWTVDLLFGRLPELVRLARQLASGDPLCRHLLRLAVRWPLSSIGLNGVGTIAAEHLPTDPALRRLYVDRVIAAGDVARLGPEWVDQGVRAALGLHPELHPVLASRVGAVAPGPVSAFVPPSFP